MTVDTLRYVDGELSYQWYRVTDDGNEPVIGETSADFSAPIPNTEEETYTYFCEVSTLTASGTSRYIHVTRTAEWALFERVPDIYVSPDAQYYTTVTIEYNPSARYRVSWYSNTEPNYNGTEYNSYTHYGYDELDLDLPDGDEPLYYYFYATDNTGKTYRSNIIQVIRTGVSLGELELTRLFNPASHEAPGYDNTDIYQYIGAETYAYLSCYESYSHSDHFEATFYRADDEGFTENVSVLGTISTDRLSEYSSVDNAIFDLGLKFRVPSDTVGEYYVRAEYTNSYEGESRTATTNSIKVVNEDKTKEDYFKFNESSGIISAYYGTEETVVFPTEINGVAVTELDYLAGITYRTWADTVERTGKSYRNIVIPEGIGKVSDYCFLGQRYLSDITLPNSLHTVGNSAFYNCPNVTTITVGEGNTESGMYGRALNAGDFSFSKLPKLTYVDLSAIKGESAFWGAFIDCPNLTKITAPVFGTAYFREASYNSNYLNYINPFNKSINMLEIENVENTGVAYKWNTNVSYSVLPVYVMIKDGYGTADYDDNFVYLSDEANSGYIIAALRRNVVNGNSSMEFPSSFKDVPITRIGVNHELDAFLESGVYATSVVIPQGVKTIGEKAFLEMYTLETVELPLSLKEINSFAFHTEGYNSNIIVNGEVQRGRLTSVNLNETSLSYVGSYAFYNQKLCDFGDLDFIDGAYIGEYAFAVYFQKTEERTENLSSITAHGNLWVGRDAFLNRFSLRSLSISGTLKLDQDAFENFYYLETAEYSGEIEEGEQHYTSRGFAHLRYTLAAPTVTDTKYYSNGYYNSYYQKTYRRVGDFGYSYTRTVKNEGTSSEPIWVVNGDKVVTMELYLRLDETTSSANGALALNYTNAALSTAIVYVDGEEVSSTELKVGAASKVRLPYTLPTDEETDTNHSIYVSVLDGEGISVWQSYTYPITHTMSPAPVPKVLNIRVSNENASNDGKARVSNASYNFVTGEYNAMKLIFPNESFNPDGTIAKDITFDYYLELDNPELVPYGEIYLSVWCNEDEPVIHNVILTYNEASDTFDGKLKFPGGTKTVFDMPYGFDIDIPTEGNNEEISQEIIDKADTLAGLFSDFNDEEVAQHYSTDMDIDTFRYVLNNDEELQSLTKDEKQSLVEVAEARNDINEAYRDLSAKIQENLSGMYDGELLGDWNAVFEANDIYAVSLDTEGLTEGILLSQGYKKYDTAGGVFYVLTMDDRSVVVSLSNNFSITFAQNSHIIDAIKGKNSKSVYPVSAQDAKLHLENSFNNRVDNFHTLYTKLYSPALLFVSAVDGAMDGILGLIEAICKYNDKKDDIIEKLELRDKDILDVVKKKLTVTEVQIGGTKLDTKDWNVVDVLDESQITKSSKNFFGSFKEYILLMRNEVAKFINKGPQYLKAGGKALRLKEKPLQYLPSTAISTA